MIIGNNTSFNNNDNNFRNKMDAIRENSKNMNDNHSSSISTNQYKDINNSNEIIDRSLDILQDRYDSGLISYEDYYQQCVKLGKLRK